MSVSENISRIDSALNQLEKLVQRRQCPELFWPEWLKAIRTVCGASLARVGLKHSWSAHAFEEWTLFHSGNVSTDAAEAFDIHQSAIVSWYATVNFSANTPGQKITSDDPVIRGFREIAESYVHVTASLSATQFREAEAFKAELASAASQALVQSLLCQQGAIVLRAERISVFQVRGDRCYLECSTGHQQGSLRTDAVRDLETIASRVLASRESLFIDHSEEQHSRIILTLPISVSGEVVQAITIEWSTFFEFVGAVEYALLIAPTIQATCSRLANPTVSAKDKKRRFRRLAGLIFPCTVVAAFWITKDIETPRQVSATGYLQPKSQRMIFANCDGYVEQIFASQDQLVRSGEPLVLLRSPEAELRIQQIQGQIAATLEQRSGLKLALSEARGTGQASQTLAYKIAADIAGLDARIKGLENQKEIVEQQLASFRIISPVDGVVTSQDFQQTLAGKPVTQGEPLLRVCDTSGDWLLLLEVDQRDIVEVVEAHQASSEEQPVAVKFRLVNHPQKVVEGRIVSIDNMVFPSDQTTATIDNRQVVVVQADFDRSHVDHLQIDATVNAKIVCGEAPWWKNITRDLVDALRRRFWINV